MNQEKINKKQNTGTALDFFAENPSTKENLSNNVPLSTSENQVDLEKVVQDGPLPPKENNAQNQNIQTNFTSSPKKKYKNLLTIGIVSFDDIEYLWHLFYSIFKVPQGIDDFQVLFLENGDNQDSIKFVENSFPDVKVFENKKNTGFCNGHNFLIDASDSEYYFCINPKTILEEGAIKKMIDCIKSDENIAAISPLIMKWNYHNHENHQKTDIIDCAGINLTLGQEFISRGRGENYSEKYAKQETVFALSSIATIYRISALDQIAHDLVDQGNEGNAKIKEYFDKDFFSQKANIDISYRLKWAGFNLVFFPFTKAWHDRKFIERKRYFEALAQKSSTPKKFRYDNYKNEYLILEKNFIPFIKEFSIETQSAFKSHKWRYFLKCFFLDPFLFLGAFFKSQRLWKKMFSKSKTINRKISAKQLENLFIKE